MSTFTQFLGGGAEGGGAGAYRQEIFLESGTFTAPQDGEYLVTAIGAGGSGGSRGASPGLGVAASGGGAGGFCQKVVTLNKDDDLTIVIGAGGTGVSSPNTGNAGGDTTVVGPGISLEAKGGAGGNQNSLPALPPGAPGVNNVSASGAAGGAASGGDVNVSGGGSGAGVTTRLANFRGSSGGGAVGVYGITPPPSPSGSPFPPANRTAPGANVSVPPVAQNLTGSTFINAYFGASGLGVLGSLGRLLEPEANKWGLSQVGLPGRASPSNAAGASAVADIFAGSGGASGNSGQSFFGGGSGGVSGTSGKGGDGVVFIEYFNTSIKEVSSLL